MAFGRHYYSIPKCLNASFIGSTLSAGQGFFLAIALSRLCAGLTGRSQLSFTCAIQHVSAQNPYLFFIHSRISRYVAILRNLFL